MAINNTIHRIWIKVPQYDFNSIESYGYPSYAEDWFEED